MGCKKETDILWIDPAKTNYYQKTFCCVFHRRYKATSIRRMHQSLDKGCKYRAVLTTIPKRVSVTTDDFMKSKFKCLPIHNLRMLSCTQTGSIMTQRDHIQLETFLYRTGACFRKKSTTIVISMGLGFHQGLSCESWAVSMLSLVAQGQQRPFLMSFCQKSFDYMERKTQFPLTELICI